MCKKQDSLHLNSDVNTTVSAAKKNDAQAVSDIQPSQILSSASVTSVAIGPSMSDLDSDSDELCLPSVSEAIRMLDLDSQTPPTNEKDAAPSQNTLPTLGPLRLPNSLLISTNNVSGNSWPSVGYCSSLLQQFVAKSQSGEPPPPPPTLMLPTKGARKCFPPNEEPLSSTNTSDPGSLKRTCAGSVDVTRSSSFGAITNASVSTSVTGSHADQELDMMVPLRGLDCHQSHVSPDSGIQSVSGSPFSVHSSPVHPSGGAGSNHNQTGSQPQPLVVSPCPPISSPSPSYRQKQTNKKSASNKNLAPKNQGISFPTKVKSNGSRQNGSRNRRPRSCRDTASALSSGLGKDSSIVQAIHRGMNAALRLKNKDSTEEGIGSSEAVVASFSTTENPSRKKRCTKKKHKNGNDKEKKNIKTLTPVTESPFRNEPADQMRHSTVTESAEDNQMRSAQQQEEAKPSELKVATTRSPSPRRSKRKKKRKKHKNSVHDQDSAVPVDPNLLSTLDSLCSRLDSCVISRSVAQSGPANCDKRPWIFQQRKYHAITIGSNGSGNSRNKRKKVAEEVGVHSNIPAVATKRKNKPKKTGCGSQVVPVSAVSNVETTREGEPTVATFAAAAVLSAVELLLPLKKRHHHLATAETPVVGSTPIDVHQCDSAIEKPSQVQVVVTKVVVNQPQPPSSRKRAANSESNTESTESKGTDQGERKAQVGTNQKSKRTHKKVKTSGIEDVIAAVAAAAEEAVPVLPDRTAAETSTISSVTPVPLQGDGEAHGSQPNKKKIRRRKTFNRTGFPSVKKKRKKPPSPTLAPSPSVPHNPSKNDEAIPSINNPTFRVAKRAKMMPKEEEDEDEDAILPDPTSSEASSGDESNPFLPLPSIKGTQPKKRRNSTMRKRYLPAGLLSNYFKEDSETNSVTTSVAAAKVLTYEPDEHEHGLLPAPFYCERFLRRTKRDFQLPFDLWWLHQQGKLPGRDNLVPSWNYKKIRTNIYYDVKPPFTNDAEPCNCTLPPPDAKGKKINHYFFKIHI